MSELGTGSGCTVFDIDKDELDRVRVELPALDHRKLG